MRQRKPGAVAAGGLLATLLALGPAIAARAQNQQLVVRDGTIGAEPPGIVAPGFDDLGQPADYLIRADLGEQRGGNLFHSFERFSIGTGETAAFTAQGAPEPGAIGHVISRVTGLEESSIDGTLRSTIAGADVWLMNPNGLVFGQNARLDVPAGFHASTADSLELANGEVFEARAAAMLPLLAVDPPEAFGFLGDADVRIDGFLVVPEGETLSVAVGGALEVRGLVEAPAGAVHLEGGRIAVDGFISADALFRVRLEARDEVVVSGYVSASASPFDGGFGNGGNIEIDGGRIEVGGALAADGASSFDLGEIVSGDGGSVRLTARDEVVVSGSVSASASPFFGFGSFGNGGSIDIEAGRVTVGGVVAADGAGVDFISGDGGSVRLAARDEVVVSGYVSASASPFSSGSGGVIEIAAPRILPLGTLLVDGGFFGGLPGTIIFDGEVEVPNAGLVERDGSLGSAPAGVVLGGADAESVVHYLITPDLGRQVGSNLLHSFLRFGLASGEIASFTGPDPLDGPQSVRNVLARVTGGEVSEIRGTIRTTIPGAALWLLNPAGWIFGPGARLDVLGAFHATTADAIGFDSEELFFADPEAAIPLVESALPTHFVLEPDNTGSIDLDGAQLAVPDGQQLSLRAGDGVHVGVGADVSAPEGAIEIEASRVSVSGSMRADGFVRGGTVRLTARDEVDVSGSISASSFGFDSAGGRIEITAPRIRPSGILRVDGGFDGPAGTILLDGEVEVPNAGLVERDGSLGSAPAGVVRGGADAGGVVHYLITPDLGKQVGSNLLHSFLRFGLASGEIASFTGPDPLDGPQSVRNVLARVTGGEVSEIRGTIRTTIPGAALWLLNPAGWIFGSGARLDVMGALHVGTAEAVAFDSEGALPTGFTIAPDNDGSLRVDSGAFLRVRGGERLALEAPHIAVSSAEIVAPGGDVSLRAPGEIDLLGSTIDVGGEAPGSIFIQGRQLVVRGGVVLAENRGVGPGGSIKVVTSEEVLVDNGLLSVDTWSSGTGGKIQIDGGAITITGGASVRANGPHASSGDAGRIEIVADSIEVSARSDISAVVDPPSQSNGGVIEIDVAGKLRLDGAEGYALIQTSSQGSRGAPGRIDIEAGSVELENGGTIKSDCDRCGSKVGNPDRPERAGAIEIVADHMIVQGQGPNEADDSNVNASSFFGDGDAGTIDLKVTHSLQLLGGGVIQAQGSGIDNPGATSNGGDIRIEAGSVFISGVGQFPSGINAQAESTLGHAGTVEITTESLTIGAGGVIVAGSNRGGDAGTINVIASESILLDHESGERFSLRRALLPDPQEPPLVLTAIGSGTILGGDGGAITLDAPDITVTRGAIVTSATVGGGPGGTTLLRGERLHILDGGIVSSASVPFPSADPIPGGPAGSTTLEASESIEISGQHPEFGDASNVGSATLGSGEAGGVTLQAPRIVVDGGVVATTAAPAQGLPEAGAGGDITLVADAVFVRGGGRIDASTFVGAPSGRVEVRASESIVVEGQGSAIASRTGGGGAGGEVTLRAREIEVSADGEVSARSAEGFGELRELFGIVADLLPEEQDLPAATGNAGDVTLVADKLLLDGGTIATNAELADGGNVRVQARELVHLDGGVITAAVSDGAGGNITIDPEVVILQNGSRIVATAGAGSGGNILITADNYFAFPGTVVDASSDLGIDGIVEVNGPDADLAGSLAALSESALDASDRLAERCSARRRGERQGSFTVAGAGLRPGPEGWLSAWSPAEAQPFASLALADGRCR